MSSVTDGHHAQREMVCGPTVVLPPVRTAGSLLLTAFPWLESRAILTHLLGLWENGGQEPPLLFPCLVWALPWNGSGGLSLHVSVPGFHPVEEKPISNLLSLAL